MIKIYTIDPDLIDGAVNNLTYDDVINMGELQSASSNCENALTVLIWLINEERLNTETFLIAVDETSKEVLSHQKF